MNAAQLSDLHALLCKYRNSSNVAFGSDLDQNIGRVLDAIEDAIEVRK